MKSGEKIEQKMAAYLKANPGSERLMHSLREKYRSFGRFSGLLCLVLTQQEAEFLNGLLKKHYREGDEVRLSAAKFLQAFERTRFKDSDFLQVCELYYGAALATKKDERSGSVKQRQEFFESLHEQLRHSRTGEWLEALTEGNAAGQEYLYSLYKKGERDLEKHVKNLVKIEKLLSGGYPASLPILAAKATKNPHALDLDQDLFRILIYFLSYLHKREIPRNQEELHGLLVQAGIQQDAGTRTIMTYGLKASGQRGGKGWETFWKNREPLILSLKNLDRVDRIQAVSGQLPVFVFENPAVFMRMIELVPEAACLCTSGQFHALDHYFIKILLQESSQKLYYSGDYDPEGLLIADKLWLLYPEQVEPLGYTVDLYDSALSEQSVTAKRLQQLENLKNPCLVTLANEIKIKQRAGYQEYVIDSLAEKIRKIIR